MECDIIEERNCVRLLGKALPISVYKEYLVPVNSKTVMLDRAEMISLASEKMSAALTEMLSGATLLRIKTDGEFTDGAYIMISDVIYTKQIGAQRPFDAQ